MPRAFVDTNVFVYANEADEPDRREAAVRLVAELAESQTGVVSTQVLVEYGSVALRKLGQSPAEIEAEASFIASKFVVVAVTPGLIGMAARLALGHTIHYFDALMLAAAESAGCTEIYTEDLNPGQSYAGVRVVNPFAS